MVRDPAKQERPGLSDAVQDARELPTEPISATTTVAGPTSPRHVLPKDLPHAVKQLNDDELDRLSKVVFDEAKRRGRLAPGVGADVAPSSRPTTDLVTKRTPRMADQRKVDMGEIRLTRGQLNAVRSAFKAGITPSRIARQFGLSQSSVRKALASDD